jgi:hypothetical protein
LTDGNCCFLEQICGTVIGGLPAHARHWIPRCNQPHIWRRNSGSFSRGRRPQKPLFNKSWRLPDIGLVKEKGRVGIRKLNFMEAGFHFVPEGHAIVARRFIAGLAKI